uniref:Protein kinase domain-containing protein n=1 Tax=Panagrolaimus sp. ES5 TaxID=591445 RepID=A0AC34F751_9BILA
MGSNRQPDPMMPQVGGSITHPEHGEFKILKSLASGPFSDVFKVLHIQGNERYAMKCEKEEGNIRPVLKLDVYVLTQMAKIGRGVGFPKLICAGRTGYYKYAIMQLVGADLGRLRRAMPDKRFTETTSILVALQTLNRIETLHDLGWLCRDIKSPNFAIGRGNEAGTVFMLDFGFARRYKDVSGNLLPPRNAAALLGTIHYAALASHYNQEQCQSWLYMVIEMAAGSLPWANLDALKQHKMIAEAKKFARTAGRSQLFEGCPKEYDELMDVIDNIGFYERPNYHKLAIILEAAIERLKIDRYAQLDWQLSGYDLIKRADVIGDLGESNLLSARLKEAHSEENIYAQENNNYFPLDEPNLVSCSSPTMIVVPEGHLPINEGSEEKTQSNHSFNDAHSPRYNKY